jgi:hypothetical protein
VTDVDRTASDAQPAHLRLDLRAVAAEDVLDRVERALGVRLERAAAVRKRRTIGARSDRGTWVRVECRGDDRDIGQGWGLEAARVVRGVPAPRWFAGASWFDEYRRVTWRADEIEYVDEPTLGRADAAVDLPDSWWSALADAMDQISHSRTTRRATPDCEPLTRERVVGAITRVFPSISDVELDEWSPAHADLGWPNLTGPKLWILDWEDYGLAPRGLDAASLWAGSLIVPALAAQVLRCLRADLESRSGRVMRLFKCAELLAWADDREPLYSPMGVEAEKLLAEGF